MNPTLANPIPKHIIPQTKASAVAICGFVYSSPVISLTWAITFATSSDMTATGWSHAATSQIPL